MQGLGLLAAILISITLSGCQRERPSIPSPDLTKVGAKPYTKFLKIKVSAGGEITVDGHTTSLDQLSTKLAELKQAGGAVLYHRDNPQGPPHPNAMRVIQLVAQNKLPIRLSVRPDFSDAVDAKGVPHPK